MVSFFGVSRVSKGFFWSLSGSLGGLLLAQLKGGPVSPESLDPQWLTFSLFWLLVFPTKKD